MCQGQNFRNRNSLFGEVVPLFWLTAQKPEACIERFTVHQATWCDDVEMSCQGHRGNDDVIVRSRDLRRGCPVLQRHRRSSAVNLTLTTRLLLMLLLLQIAIRLFSIVTLNNAVVAYMLCSKQQFFLVNGIFSFVTILTSVFVVSTLTPLSFWLFWTWAHVNF